MTGSTAPSADENRSGHVSSHAQLRAFGALPQQDRRDGGNDDTTCEDEETGAGQRNERRARNDQGSSNAEQHLQHVHIFDRLLR